MKTIFEFKEFTGKQKVILRHENEVEIFKENRKDHMEWTDSSGNKIINREYIVVRFPKTRNVDWSKWTERRQDDWHFGYQKIETDDRVELLFYDQITFSWIVTQLEDMGLLRATQRMMRDWKTGDIFPCYINAHGVWQVSYNIFFGLSQLPFVLYQDYQYNKEREKKFETKQE